MHIVRRRGRKRECRGAGVGAGKGGAGGRAEAPDLLVRLVLPGRGGHKGGDPGGVEVGKEHRVQLGVLVAQGDPEAPPAGGLDGPALLQRLDEPQPRDLHLFVQLDVVVDGQVQGARRGVLHVDAAPAVLAGATTKGRQAQIVPAAHGLGGQPAQIVVARLDPGVGGSDAVGLGHDAGG